MPSLTRYLQADEEWASALRFCANVRGRQLS